MRHDPRQFPNAQLLALGITVPVGIGVLTEVGLPVIMGIQQIPIASTTMSAFSLVAAIGLVRNRLFEVDTVATARGIIESISDALVVLDPDGTVRFANRTAREQFNIGPGARQQLHTFLRSESEARAFRAGPWNRALSGGRQYGLEMTLLDRNQQPVDCLVSLNAIRQGPAVGVMIVAHDISELREVEAELALARERVEEGRESDGPWIAHLSDELRNPVNAILGCAKLLDESGVSNPELLQRIHAQGSQLLRLLSDVIDVSQVDSGELPLSVEPTDVTQTLRAIAPICRKVVQNQKNRVDFQLAESVYVVVDPVRLRQIVLGVLSFLNQMGRQRVLIVTATRENERQGVIRFDLPEVTLPADQLANALDRLPRSGGAKAARLTLALSRRLCQLMDGELLATPLNNGTQLVVRLPAAVAPPVHEVA